MIGGEVADDADEPRAEPFRLAQIAEPLPRPDEGVLDDVAGGVAVAGPAERDRKRRPLVSADERRERAGIAALRTAHQFVQRSVQASSRSLRAAPRRAHMSIEQTVDATVS